jgi:hypothetical protein
MQANRTGEMEAACHCGTVRFRVKLTDGFNTARRCTCSYCRMRSAVAVSADVGGVTFDAGEEALTVHRFNTGVAQHYFCSRCGIYTHHRRRSNPNQYGVVLNSSSISAFGTKRTFVCAAVMSAFG